MVSADHGSRHAIVSGLLGIFWGGRPGLQACDSASVMLGDDDVQPDAFLRRTEDAGGRTHGVGGILAGPPEFIVEVATSSAARDLHEKKASYERNGVLEYVVWQLHENRLDWFVLRDGRYEAVEPGADGVIESEQFPGLRLHVASLLAGDVAGLLAGLAK